MTKAIKSIVYLVLLVVALLVPVIVTNNFYFHLIIMSCIWAILALSLNVCMGYTGLVSVAQGSFFGIGAYASSLMVLKLGMNSWLALPLAMGIVMVISLFIGLIALRTRGPYFVICSLVFCLIVTVVIEHWEALTNGARGLTSIPPVSPIRIPGLFEISFSTMISQYYLILFFLIITLIVLRLIVNSRMGRAFEAVKLNEVLADSLGINVMLTKISSFVLAALFAGLAGFLYAPYIAYLNPADSSFWISFETIMYTIVGGSGTLAGPVIGAFLLTIVPEMLRFFEEYRLFFYSVVLILTVIFFPQGFVGLPGFIISKVSKYQKRRQMTEVNSWNTFWK